MIPMENLVINTEVLAQQMRLNVGCHWEKSILRQKRPTDQRHILESSARSKGKKDVGSVPATVTDLLCNLGHFMLLLFFLCLFGLL